MSIKVGLFIALALFTSVYVATWFLSVWRDRRNPPSPPGAPERPTLGETVVGFLTNFFDTLGIGSFAPTTSAYKLRRMVVDELIPGTLNVGHTLAAVTQSFIFIAIIEVDMVTLALLIGAAVAGAWLGAGVVASWPRRNIQIGMGCALLVAATLFTMTNLDVFPGGGEALGLQGTRLAIGLVGCFVLGALMTLGIGFYGPCMILVSLLGMNSKTAYPIMMGSCAFLMPVASMRFIKEKSYNLRPALGLALGGIPAVLIAAPLVDKMSLVMVRWLVVVVVLYAAAVMLRSAFAEGRELPAPEGLAP